MSSKEIKVLTSSEHIRKRPEMYVGSVGLSEEKVPIFDKGKFKFESREISVGMYKIFHEVFDNAYDEAKRQNGKMKSIEIHLSTKDNQITVIDDGGGFEKGHQINQKSGMSHIETAVSVLMAGSNFDNEESEVALLGMHGVGVSCTNVLSDYFSIQTTEKGSIKKFQQQWNDFVPQGKMKWEKTSAKDHGTEISFIPRKGTFGNMKYDPEIIKSYLILKKYAIDANKELRSLKIKYFVDGKNEKIDVNVFPDNTVLISNKLGLIALHPNHENSDHISLVNSAHCTGIHQTIVHQFISDIHKYQYSQRHFTSFIILNLPPRYVKFAGQNKTRLATPRPEIEQILLKSFGSELQQKYKASELKKIVDSEIKREKDRSNLSHIKRQKRKSKIVLSEKYLPPASMRGDKDIFITEGLSAGGSMSQKRNSKTQAIYSLKGKPQNVKDIETLKNQEFIELISILGLEPGKEKQEPKFKRIIIAADSDADGIHIESLLINFFYRWFPDVIKQGFLYLLETPIGICEVNKNKKYFYSLSEYENFLNSTKNISNQKYAKGLGSYSLNDWDFIMNNIKLEKIYLDELSNNAINLAFGDDANIRKKYLMGQVELKNVPVI
jgi:topoisomerase IV subunit B